MSLNISSTRSFGSNGVLYGAVEQDGEASVATDGSKGYGFTAKYGSAPRTSALWRADGGTNGVLVALNPSNDKPGKTETDATAGADEPSAGGCGFHVKEAKISVEAGVNVGVGKAGIKGEVTIEKDAGQ